MIRSEDVSPDGSSFNIRHGKSENAVRFVPIAVLLLRIIRG
jgi:hypothetical protein